MQRPAEAVTTSPESLVGIIDAFLDWTNRNRAPDTYEWYRYRLQRFVDKYPDMRVSTLKPYHVDEWVSGLRSAIHRDGGSVLVWHRQFEESRNGELGELLPEFRDFFLSLNHRIFDLEEVFKQQLIMDYHFKGRSSFKAIRRILCAQFSYTDLNVQNGAQAMYAWYEWVQGTLNTELLAYCKLDTLAMVEILCEIARS